MIFSSFPKIFTIGQPYINLIFDDEVEVTEKLDGSQFSFGVVNGELLMRSKGCQLYSEVAEKMFKKGIDYVHGLYESCRLKEGHIFYGEYFNFHRHNLICYDRIPKNGICIFGISAPRIGNPSCDVSILTTKDFISSHEELTKEAALLDLETVPLLYKGKIDSPDFLLKMVEKESFLGKSQMEGVVVKNYHRQFLLGGQPIPIMMGKYVREDFKEISKNSWSKENTNQGRWEMYKSQFSTTARWLKSIQHLKEKGELENSPRDIGKLMKEINVDIETEEKEGIKEHLWKEFGREVLRVAAKGFPEFYKKYLLENSFIKEPPDVDNI